MSRLLSILSISLGLVATSVAPAQEPEAKFMDFPAVKVKAIDFQQVFFSSPSDAILQPEPGQESDLPAPSEDIEEGLIVDGVDHQETVAPVNETITVAPQQCCHECRQTAPCNCEPNGRVCGRLERCWHSTCIYRKHIQNLGDPCLFCERPFGVCNEGFQGAMIMAGKADRAMLHHYDFIHHADGGVELTPRGHHELVRISDLMEELPVALSIESTDHPHVDEARRLAVVNAIARLGVPISPGSIQISADRTIGLSGVDAQAVHTIRTSEAATGATRSLPYRDSAAATRIPLLTGQQGGSSN